MARYSQPPGPTVSVNVLTIKIELPGCHSLKEKRQRIKPILHRLHREFNLSAAEIGAQNVWQTSWIGCSALSADSVHNSKVLNKVIHYLEENFPEEIILEHHIEYR